MEAFDVWMRVLENPKSIVLTAVFLAEYGSGLLLLYTSLRPSLQSKLHTSSPCTTTATYVQQLVWAGLLNVVSALACYFLVMTNINQQNTWLSYLQWGGATPPMIVVLCLVFGLDHATTILLVFLDLVVIMLSYTASLYTHSSIKTVTFALSCLHFLGVFGAFLAKKFCSTKSPHYTSLLGSDSRISFYLLFLILFSWLFQPISWLLTEGGFMHSNVYVDVARGSFTVIAKVLFGLILFHYRAHLTKVLDASPLTVLPSPSPSSAASLA